MYLNEREISLIRSWSIRSNSTFNLEDIVSKVTLAALTCSVNYKESLGGKYEIRRSTWKMKDKLSILNDSMNKLF